MLYRIPGKEATCLEEGILESWKCALCSKLFLDENGTMETTEEGLVILSAGGHSPGEPIKENENIIIGSYESVVYCTACGAELSRETKEALLNPFNALSMSVGSSLETILEVRPATLPEGENYYALVTKYHPDGTVSETIIGKDEWQGGSTKKRIIFKNISAKEMATRITTVICNEAGEVITEAYEMTVRDYIMGKVNETYQSLQADPNNEANVKFMTMLVDMLNYGAVAQSRFDYNVNDPANAALTAEHLQYASTDVSVTNNQRYEGCFVESTLSAGSKIDMNFFFARSVLGTDKSVLRAEVSFKRFNGTEVSYEIPSDAIKRSGSNWVVIVNQLNMPDGYNDVTVKIYKGDELMATVTDQVTGYLARGLEADPTNAMFIATAKLVKSSCDYFTFRVNNQ